MAPPATTGSAQRPGRRGRPAAREAKASAPVMANYRCTSTTFVRCATRRKPRGRCKGEGEGGAGSRRHCTTKEKEMSGGPTTTCARSATTGSREPAPRQLATSHAARTTPLAGGQHEHRGSAGRGGTGAPPPPLRPLPPQPEGVKSVRNFLALQRRRGGPGPGPRRWRRFFSAVLVPCTTTTGAVQNSCNACVHLREAGYRPL